MISVTSPHCCTSICTPQLPCLSHLKTYPVPLLHVTSSSSRTRLTVNQWLTLICMSLSQMLLKIYQTDSQAPHTSLSLMLLMPLLILSLTDSHFLSDLSSLPDISYFFLLLTYLLLLMQALLSPEWIMLLFPLQLIILNTPWSLGTNSNNFRTSQISRPTQLLPSNHLTPWS